MLELALPADPRSVRSARRALSDYCARKGVPPEDTASAVLAVSELVTNVVLHAQTPFLLCAEYDGRQLTLAVVDGTPTAPLPGPRSVPSSEPGGRGMGIVGRLGPWGVFRTPLGKTVWATVDPEA